MALSELQFSHKTDLKAPDVKFADNFQVADSSFHVNISDFIVQGDIFLDKILVLSDIIVQNPNILHCK